MYPVVETDTSLSPREHVRLAPRSYRWQQFVTFDCGEPSLNEWLRSRALKNETTGASRTFVTVEAESGDVAGYYCQSASALALEDAPGRVTRNELPPIPIILNGRLAVDERFTGHGLGASLLQHAVL